MEDIQVANMRNHDLGARHAAASCIILGTWDSTLLEQTLDIWKEEINAL